MPLLAARTAQAEVGFDVSDDSALPGSAKGHVVKKWTLEPVDAACERAASDLPQALGTVEHAFPVDFSVAPVAFGPAPAVITVPAATTATSGYLSTTTSQNYSTAPWVITAGDGTYPDLGGVATFNEQVAPTPGTLNSYTTITLDVGVTLSGLTYNSDYEYVLAAGTGGSLSLTTTGTNTFNAQLSQTSTPTLTSLGHEITAPVGGGGMFGLTKTGPGTITLEATNTYTGGTTINAGTLFTYYGDASLGATGAGNDVTLNGGTLAVASTALTTARNFTLGTNGGTISLFAAATVSGVVSGSGGLTFGLGGSVLTLTAANTYTGATTMNANSTFTLNGNGSVTASSAYDLRSTVNLDDSGTNVADRLSDTAPLTLRGVNLTLTGNTASAASETVGAATLANGFDILTVTPNSTEPARLNLTSLTRQNNSTLYLRGAGLGSTAGAVNIATITATGVGSSLVGGGGTAGTTSISIVPWAIGNTSTSTSLTAANNVGASFVTYDATNGFRPLATTEYATTFGTGVNVRLTANAAAAGTGVTANALLYAPSTTTPVLSGSVNLTSGAFLYSPTAASSNQGSVTAALNFGTAEGIITTTGLLGVSGVLSGSNGLTLSVDASNGYILLSGTANTYTGNTAINGGSVYYAGTVAANGTNSTFGSNGDVILNAGLNSVFLVTNGATTTLNRNLTVLGTGLNYFGAPTTGTPLTMNGNVNLQNNLYMYGAANAAASAITFNGGISGTSGIYDRGGSYVVFNGNDTYSGNTLIGSGSSGSTFVAGSDTAFGTSTIYFNASSGTSTLSSGAAARTLANNVVLGASSNAFAGTAALTLNGSVNLNGSETISISNTSAGGVTFGGVVSGGGITKTSAGVLTFSNANTYTGGTVVSTGSLLVTNTAGSGTGAGAVSVTGAGRLLGGTGIIAGPVSIATTSIVQGGTGAATGALTLNNNLTLVSGSIIELGLDAAGDASSLTRSGGTWMLPSGIKFTFTGSPTIGQTYNNLLTGLAADPGTESSWTTTNNGFSGTFVYDGAGDIDLTMTAVPEPATVLGGVLTAGLLGWGLRRRLRRAT